MVNKEGVSEHIIILLNILYMWKVIYDHLHVDRRMTLIIRSQ